MFRISRSILAVLLLFVLATGCKAEGECIDTSPGECTNPDVTSDATSSEVVPDDTSSEDPSCPSRPYVIRCAGEYLDTNKNGKLDRDELEAAIKKLPWYSRGKRFEDITFIDMLCFLQVMNIPSLRNSQNLG